MTLVRLGYVAMSVELKNCSPSQTMTYAQYQKFTNRESAINKLEGISKSNLENCLRLLRHNRSHDIKFFRLSSKLIPLATHEALKGWDYLAPLQDSFSLIKKFLASNSMRIDFHPDHFVLLNSPKEEVLEQSIINLKLHLDLLKGMSIDPAHRCVIHIGGKYNDTETSLERFVSNWGKLSPEIQKSIILENDDKSFHLQDTLYLCERLGIPLVFDYHHHLAHHQKSNWEEDWSRIIDTWAISRLPVKVHISSPKSEKQYRHHADYIDVKGLLVFLDKIKGSLDELDCMIEAKQKDAALFRLVEDLKGIPGIKFIDEVNFEIG